MGRPEANPERPRDSGLRLKMRLSLLHFNPFEKDSGEPSPGAQRRTGLPPRAVFAQRTIVYVRASQITNVLFYAIRPCNGLDTIVSNGRKKDHVSPFIGHCPENRRLPLAGDPNRGNAGPSPDPLHPHQRGHRVRRLAGPADQGDDRLLCCISTPIWSLPYTALFL